MTKRERREKPSSCMVGEGTALAISLFMKNIWPVESGKCPPRMLRLVDTCNIVLFSGLRESSAHGEEHGGAVPVSAVRF